MSASTDASRIAFVQVMPDDTKQSAVAFLNAAVTYYESLSVKVARVMTDNGGYGALAFCDACRALALRHIRTRPYTPRTNGKAEQTQLVDRPVWYLSLSCPRSRPSDESTSPN
jgi:transposase InsO family protein